MYHAGRESIMRTTAFLSHITTTPGADLEPNLDSGRTVLSLLRMVGPLSHGGESKQYLRTLVTESQYLSSLAVLRNIFSIRISQFTTLATDHMIKNHIV